MNSALKPVVLTTAAKTDSVVHLAKKVADLKAVDLKAAAKAALKVVPKTVSSLAATPALPAAALVTSSPGVPSLWALAASSRTPQAAKARPSATPVPRS